MPPGGTAAETIVPRRWASSIDRHNCIGLPQERGLHGLASTGLSASSVGLITPNAALCELGGGWWDCVPGGSCAERGRPKPRRRTTSQKGGLCAVVLWLSFCQNLYGVECASHPDVIASSWFLPSFLFVSSPLHPHTQAPGPGPPRPRRQGRHDHIRLNGRAAINDNVDHPWQKATATTSLSPSLVVVASPRVVLPSLPPSLVPNSHRQ
jgi:hypothetical protein